MGQKLNQKLNQKISADDDLKQGKSFGMKNKVMRVFLASAFLASCALAQSPSLSAQAAPSSVPASVSATPPIPLTGEQKGELLIKKLTHNFVQVTNNFDAPGGLIGYVIQPIGKKRGNIIYTDKTGEYLFSGSIVNASGENITQKETETYVDAKLIDEMYQNLGGLNFFAQGKDSAPHKMYIVFDPNCSICHLVFGAVQPMIDSGNLQVRWIPVGIMQMSSVGKAAAIMMGKDDAAKLALLKQDENNFDMKTESGGVPELKKASPIPADSGVSDKGSNKTEKDLAKPKLDQQQQAEEAKISAAFDLVAKNNQYFSTYGFNGTPVFFLKYQTGEKKFFPGYYQGTWLADQINKAGNTWE